MHYTEFLNENFQDVKFIKENHYIALCPCHSDSNPSLYITYRPAKKNLICKCFVCDCSFEEICNAINKKEQDFWFDEDDEIEEAYFFSKTKIKIKNKKVDSDGITKEEYSDYKKLPLKYLEKTWGVDNSEINNINSVIFPYFDCSGKFLRNRHRIKMHGKNNFLWGKDKKNWKNIPLYGLDKFNHNEKSIILVEGESDVQTLHYLGFNVLGLPSATVYSDKLHLKYFKDIKIVYVIIEDDTGGQVLKKILQKSKLNKKIKFISLLKYKDISELYLDYQDKKKCIKLIKQELEQKKEQKKEKKKKNTYIDIELNKEKGFLDFHEIPKGNALGDMVKSVSKYNETPYALAFGLGLSVISACIRGRLKIENTNGFQEPLVIWTMSALETGERKSPVFSCMTDPIFDWEIKEIKINKIKIKSAESKRKKILAQIKKLENNTLAFDDIENNEEIKELYKNLKDSIVLPKIICRDITNQRISMEIVKQNGSTSIFSDEGEIFKNVRGNFSNQDANFDIFLAGYSGSKIDVLRASKDSEDISIRNGHLTLGLTVQPFVIADLMKNREFRESGFLARFLFLNPINKSLIKLENVDKIPVDIIKKYRIMLYSILEQTIYDKDKNGNPKPYVLILSDDAKKIISKFHIEVEKEKVTRGTVLNGILGWANKLKGNVLRVAGLLHVSKHPILPWSQKVSGKTMTLAVKYGGEFKKHAAFSFGRNELSTELLKAEKIINWLIKKKKENFTKREILRSLKREFQKVKELDDPIEVLIERNYIKKENKKTKNGKTVIYFDVNPNFIKEKY